MYVISRISPSAPDGKIYWAGQLTDVPSENDEVIISPSFSYFVEDAFAVKTKIEAVVLAGLFNIFSPSPDKLWTARGSE